MSLKVVTFSNGTGLHSLITSAKSFVPYLSKYSFASLQSTKFTK